MPCIDGTPLSDLVAAYDRAQGYTDPAGGYGAIVPSSYLGPLGSYFLGEEEPMNGGAQGTIYALFCKCGDPDCWPLTAHVHASEQLVVWDRFAQHYRPDRDYSGFGPFEFARSDYEKAVAIAAKLEVRS